LDLVAYVSPRDLDEIAGDRNLTVMPYDALSYSFFALNCDRGVLKDKRVRRAISAAINRNEMLQAFFQSRGQLISGPFPPTSWAYNLDVPLTAYDQKAAAALLKEAGLKDTNGDGILESRTGTPVKLLFAVPLTGESEMIKRMALAFQDYLRKVGVGVELQFMDWLVWKKRVLGEHDYDLTIASWSFDDASNIASLFHSSSAVPYGNNFVNFRSSEVDSLLTEADATSDFDKRRAIYHKLHGVLADEAPYVYLWTLMHHAAHNARLSKVQVNPFAFFKHITMWRVKN
jgi:peptide/nickel transport system substrate-binding protein